MKKKIYLNIALLLVAGMAIQSRTAGPLYSFQSGEISFFSDAPVEDIQAKTIKFAAVVNPQSRKFAFSVPIETFVFEKSLMREHFNENYMETEKYPNGTFKGDIVEDVNLLANGSHKVNVKGLLNLHGVEKERTIPATVDIKGKEMTINSKFQVKLVDHNIEVPQVVISNIAEVIDVTVNCNLKLKD